MPVAEIPETPWFVQDEPPYATSRPELLFNTKADSTPWLVIEVEAFNVEAEIFAVEVVLPSAENANVAA